MMDHIVELHVYDDNIGHVNNITVSSNGDDEKNLPRQLKGFTTAEFDRNHPVPLPQLCVLRRSGTRHEYGFKLLLDKTQGHVVGHIVPHSPADFCGLVTGYNVVAVNGIRTKGLHHKDVIQLIAEKGLECNLLVLNETDASWYQKSNVEIPLKYSIVVPHNRNRSFLRSESIRLSIKKKTEKARTTWLQCPWSVRRITTVVVSILSIVLLASIVDTAVQTHTKKRAVYTIKWINESVVVLNTNFEGRLPVLTLSSNGSRSHWASLITTTLHFQKKFIEYHTDSGYCIVMRLNETLLPDAESVKNAARKAAARQHILHVEEDWNYAYTLLNVTEIVKLNMTNEEIDSQNPLFVVQKIRPREKSTACPNCSKVCVPEYHLKHDERNITVLSILKADCFWFQKDGHSNVNRSMVVT